MSRIILKDALNSNVTRPLTRRVKQEQKSETSKAVNHKISKMNIVKNQGTVYAVFYLMFGSELRTPSRAKFSMMCNKWCSRLLLSPKSPNYWGLTWSGPTTG